MSSQGTHNNVNERIRAESLRVISEDGENLGVLSKADALQLAREKGLDLIEIVAAANPPVARIMSFDKFRYQADKEAKQKNRAEKNKEMKRIRITPRAARNDLETKAKKARAFLERGHRIEVGIFLRGREKANKDFAKQKLQEFLDMLGVEYTVAVGPKYGGRGFSTQIVKK